MKNINLRIEPGHVAALVGPTGAGKSTIISLIPRFYDPTSGVVSIDGTDVRRFRIQSLRSRSALYCRKPYCFMRRYGITSPMGSRGAGRAEIVRAAELANAHEFIEKMPQGYDTMLGERGVTLSGGQRQRIAIARAIIRDTPILILDEPSTGLDAASEKLVFDALDRLMEGRTSIVIAHRLSTIRNAGIIYVVQEGEIVERGTHEELMKVHGLYFKLDELQFGTEVTASEVQTTAP